jgi:oxalate decarboxylase
VGYIQEPLWHPNAHKVGYCSEGCVVVTLHAQGIHETFVVNQGELFFVPKGCFHVLANDHDGRSTVLFGLGNHEPDEMTLFQAINTLSTSAFGATFHTPDQFHKALKVSGRESLVVSCPHPKMHGSDANRFKFSLSESSPLVQNAGGYLNDGTRTNLPVLQDVGVFTFGLTEQGIVEPHWHTNAGELIYVLSGNTRISILSPGGEHHVQEVSAGGGAFAPASHFHAIENIGHEPAEILAFFSAPNPDYIGLAEATAATPEVLSSTFSLPLEHFSHFTPPTGPLVIAAHKEPAKISVGYK